MICIYPRLDQPVTFLYSLPGALVVTNYTQIALSMHSRHWLPLRQLSIVGALLFVFVFPSVHATSLFYLARRLLRNMLGRACSCC